MCRPTMSRAAAWHGVTSSDLLLTHKTIPIEVLTSVKRAGLIHQPGSESFVVDVASTFNEPALFADDVTFFGVTSDTQTTLIATSSPQCNVVRRFIDGNGRSIDATPFELYGINMLSGTAVTIELLITVTVEGTSAQALARRITAIFQRNSSGVSSRVSAAAGTQESIAGNFTGAPLNFAASDPSSAVSPNVLNRAAIIVTGKAGTNILWGYTGRVVSIERA